MSKQLRVKLNSSVGAPRVTTEVSIPVAEAHNAPARFIPEELVSNQGAKEIFPETWHQGDIYDLVEERTLVIRPPVGMKLHECKITIAETPDIDAGVIHCVTKGYWRIFVVPTHDTGTNAPAEVNVSIVPNEPDPSEDDDPTTGSS